MSTLVIIIVSTLQTRLTAGSVRTKALVAIEPITTVFIHCPR